MGALVRRTGLAWIAALLGAGLALCSMVSICVGHAGPFTSSTLQVGITGGPTTGVEPLNVSLAATAAGGIAPYNYSWTVDGGEPVGYGPSFVYLFTAVGEHNVTVYAQDVFGEPGNASVSVDVMPPSLVVALGATPSSIPADTPTYLEANASGGLPPYSYTWSGLPPGCLGLDAASLRCDPTTMGGYTIRVNVTDSTGASATDLVGLVVTSGNTTVPPSTGSSPGVVISTWELVAILAGAAGAGVAIGIVARTRLRRNR